MNILLFGKTGQVGWELQRALAPLGNLIALDVHSTDYCGDFSNPEGVAETVKKIRPDVIVNAAAHTAVDKAESEPEFAQLLNATSVEAIAKAANEVGAWVIHYSTDYVFPGTGEIPWQETDATAPLNVYGETKLAGEKALQKHCAKHIIFRTSWVYAGKGNNFAKTMLRLAKEREELAVILQDAGVDVLDIGMSGTEEIYFATFHLGVDGGIEVTASHNPMDYNGMKLVREGARPISGDTGLRDVQRLAEANDFPPVDETKRGRYQQINLRDAYVDHLFGYINVKNLTPLKLVINSGNGAAGPVVDAIEARFKALGAPVELIKVHNTPDGNFPNGIPNPLLPECRDDTRNAVIKHGADMGIAFDGDFDRCFLFDEKGQFIEGYYIVGLLAEAFLEKNPGAKIIHDPRLSWNTVDVVTAAGGTPVMSKTGHAFIKERMRKEDAIYGGEMSAHHYFRDFAYCDSGMIPWLLVAELVCLKGKTLGELVRDRMAAFPASGEINSKLAHPVEAINRVEQHFSREALAVDRTDGISMTFADWRFNLRSSNTEPVVRLNVESRGDVPLMEEKTKLILELLNK
ncbi:dTDP-4-dehydrorhamnose reductase [Escherichia coli]|nr:dTDP-4-dehydrorhamnose reductase [Escherichia coli]EFU7205395.1 dTDP-4-dehydrorhamnose reductase [Escherichia coli]EID7691402.1 dTDP-4-dehydrorhamnose reductase [Escherichia coli]HAP1430295.1 dTDP-4-dehydrorhamnose reductase [Escherichia coli]